MVWTFIGSSLRNRWTKPLILNGFCGRANPPWAHAGLQIQKKDFYAVAGHLANALSAMGVHKDTIGEVVDRLEPLWCEIADHPATAWCSAASRMPIILAGCLRGFCRY